MSSPQRKYSGTAYYKFQIFVQCCKNSVKDMDCLPLSSCLQFVFSTALDGKIKAWLYDNKGSRVDYDAPGGWCTTMAYSADGSRYIGIWIWSCAFMFIISGFYS